MPLTCLLSDSFFSTPEFIYEALNIMSIIGAPIHIFGTYVIIFKSPNNLSSIKWPMLNLQFWSSTLDFLISVLVTPVALFPSIAGYSMGVLYKLGVPDFIQMHLMITFIGLVLLSILTVYENQYFLLSIKSGSWAHWRTSFLIGYYILMSTFLIPFTATIPNQDHAVDEVFQRLWCLQGILDKSRVFVYTLRFSAAFFACGFLYTTTILLTLGFIILTLRILLNNKNTGTTYSKKTLKLQKKFLTGLIIQTSVPVIVMIFPLCYLVWTVYFGLYYQAYNNFTMLVLSSHGLLSKIAMLVVHEPYRKAAVTCFVTCSRRPESRVSDTLKI